MNIEHREIERRNRRGMYATEHMGDLLREIINEPDGFLTPSPHSHILKTDATTTIARIERGRYRWVIKRYNTKDRWHAVRRIAQTSRAANCWNMSLHMRQAGIPVPVPIAFFERRRLGLRERSYFINEHVEGDVLSRCLPLDQKERDAFIPQISRMFGVFKSAGISHGDLKATNILVHKGGLVLIDLDAAQVQHSVGSRKRAYAKDRSRFLKNWQQYPELLSRFSDAIPL